MRVIDYAHLAKLRSKQTHTDFLLIEQVFCPFTVSLDALICNAAFYASLTWSRCHGMNESDINRSRAKKAIRTIVASQVCLLAECACSACLLFLGTILGLAIGRCGVSRVGHLARVAAFPFRCWRDATRWCRSQRYSVFCRWPSLAAMWLIVLCQTRECSRIDGHWLYWLKSS